jgi:HSP20 family molecular chaperone IbpA
MSDDPSSSSAWRVLRFGDSDWEPPVDVMISADVVWIRVAAPGVRPETLRVHIEGRFVSVRARPRRRRPPHGAQFVQAEIPLGGFERRIELPWEVQAPAKRMRAVDGIIELLLARLGANLEATALDEEDEHER